MTFELSNKEIPDLDAVHKQLTIFPEYEGNIKSGEVVAILLNIEPTQELIDAIEAVVPAITIPDITPVQLRTALVLSGISLESIAAIVDSFPEPQRTIAYVKWEYAVVYERNDVMVDVIAGALELTSEQIDNIWLLGATL